MPFTFSPPWTSSPKNQDGLISTLTVPRLPGLLDAEDEEGGRALVPGLEDDLADRPLEPDLLVDVVEMPGGLGRRRARDDRREQGDEEDPASHERPPFRPAGRFHWNPPMT
ncbi:MAG: hypothetical protein MZW92_67355 [Comamonadaceae bacterium]|nr:hypothetical protein [Comamonadaceae bacterium]